MSQEEWKQAERDVRDIVTSAYTGISQRVNANGNGDVFHLADVMATDPSKKMLFAQVKTTSKEISETKINQIQRTASSLLNEKHAEFELWHRDENSWKVHRIPVETRAYVTKSTVELPLDIDVAKEHYKMMKDNQRKGMEAK